MKEVDNLFGRDEEYNDDDFPDDNYDSGLSDDDLLDDETLTDEAKEDDVAYVDFDSLRASIRAGIKEREERKRIAEANKKKEREIIKDDKTELEKIHNKIKEIDGKEKYTEIYM